MKEPNIYIPSKGRPECPTAHLFSEAVQRKRVYIVVEPQDYEAYLSTKQRHNCSFLILDKNDQGITYVRNEIKKLATKQNEEYYWMLDDDIKGFYITAEGKNHKADAGAMLDASYIYLANRLKVAQGGLEYQQFAWSSTKPYVRSSYCDVCVLINTEMTKNIEYRDVPLKEDRDFTLQVITNGYDVVRLQRYSFSAPENGSNKGGLYKEYKTTGKELQMCRKMVQLWGKDICKVIKKKNGRIDVKINWSLFKNAKGD